MNALAPSNRPAHSGMWALVVGLLCLTLTACGLTPGVNSAPPQGWTDITPPDSGQNARYAVSPDTPGLLLATIGGHAQASADPLPAARLWRSRDGGAHWQSLDSLNAGSGTSLVMPPGGHGLVFAQDSRDASISVSDNAGTTWAKLPFVATPYSTMTDEWNMLSGAVAVGARLYAGGVAVGFGGMRDGSSRFAVSDDHGFTWRAVEASVDPAGSGATTRAIAPLDPTGASWLRIVATGAGPSSVGVLERSADGGATWKIQPPTLAPSGWLMSAQFATNIAHPGSVCAALTRQNMTIAVTPAAGSAFLGGAALAGPPAPLPQDISLLASDDGGRTWRGGSVLAVRNQYGGGVFPGPQMSADGSCYLATSQSDSVIGAPVNEQAALWCLAPRATTATAVFRMSDRGVLSLALAPGDSGHGERIVALTRISGPGDGQQISCGQGCMTYRDGGVYRLIWEPLLSA